jgi:3-deoxy-7-phosphoheptulonate synthase
MIIVMASRKKEDIAYVVSKIEELGYHAHLIEGRQRTVIAAVGDERGKFRLQSLESLPHVEKVLPVVQPFKLAGRETGQEDTVIHGGSVEIGGGRFCVIAGPCAVEFREQMVETAQLVNLVGKTL